MQRLPSFIEKTDFPQASINPVSLVRGIEIFNSQQGELSDQALNPTGQAAAFLLIGAIEGTALQLADQRRACLHLLQHLLRELRPEATGSWEVAHADDGSPRLLLDKQNSGYRISFSHSINRIAIALSRNYDLAVDIECFGANRNYPAMSQFMGWNSDGDGEPAFLSRWTLWEACAKISSRSSLSSHIHCFDEIGTNTSPGRVIRTGEWQVLSLQLADQACSTLILRDPKRSSLACRHFPLLACQPTGSKLRAPAPKANRA